MVTNVGRQSDFAEAVKQLIELEYDIVDGYMEAITCLRNHSYKNKVTEFLNDHKQHIFALSKMLKKHHQEAPVDGGVGKGLLTAGKVILGNMFGDETILFALHSNEKDANTAYDRMSARKDKWGDSLSILKKGQQDAHRHNATLGKILSEL